MKIEDHIFAGIEAFDRGEQEHALLHACIALDGTSQKHHRAKKSSRYNYIQFIRNYYWILEPMTGTGINFDQTYWDNIRLIDEKGNKINKLDMAAVIYYIFRCEQAHGKEIATRYKLLPRNKDLSLSYHISEDNLNIPETLIWGLLSICVFCEANKDINTNTGHYFMLGNNKFAISDWWGLESSFRPIAEKHNTTRVTLTGLTFTNEALKDFD